MIQKDYKRLVGPNGEFVSSFKLPKGEVCIGYLEELCEYLYHHNNKTPEEKLTDILSIEGIIRDILHGTEKDEPLFGIKCEYTPTWSKKTSMNIWLFQTNNISLLP